MTGSTYTRRLNDLEQRFVALADRIPDSPEKEAISVLHGMVAELWRAGDGRTSGAAREPTVADIAELSKTAPAMSGTSENVPLPVGSEAPDFTLPDASGRLVSLREWRGRPVVLAFYPLDWSPTCSDQLSLYQAEREEFERYGAQLIGISVDSLYSHGAWAAVRGLTFPLLADFEPKGEVSRRYRAYRAGDGFSERALYVIDGDGVIRYAHIAPQLDHIPDIYELFGALASITGRAAPVSSASSVGETGDTHLDRADATGADRAPAVATSEVTP